MDGFGALKYLLREATRSRPDDLADLILQTAHSLDVTALIVYLSDHQQRVLVPLPGRDRPDRDAVSIDGTLPGRVYTSGVALDVDGDGTTTVWLPVVNGSERLGVLEVTAGGPVTAEIRDGSEAVAALLAEMILSRTLYGDAIEQVRRRERMRLPAELIRAQLPPSTFSTDRLIISGILEPCYDVGGDAFDYAVNGDVAHLALFDAIGHGSNGGIRAAVLASITLAAYRNARRAGMDLTETYRHIDTAVRDHDRNGLITGILAELDQTTGMLSIISAGHPSGLVLRDGKVVKTLPSPTAMPVTMGDIQPPVVIEESLEPGDQVLLYTDGITEARDEEGEPFGVDRLVDFVARALADQLPAPETARRLVHAILDYQLGELQDDATVLLAQWRAAVAGEPG
jgi:serine phosphatase RsbU (regulator of sigma subunit)